MSDENDETDGRGEERRLQRALLDAFPERAKLRDMLYFGLNVRLNEIASESLNLTDTVVEVIDRFDRQGHLRDLIEAAREQSPGSPALQELVKSLPPLSAAVAVRRKAHRHPRYALALLGVTASGLVILTVVAPQASLTGLQLTIVRIVMGVAAALFIGVTMWQLQLRIRDAPVYAAVLAALLVAFITPANAGLMTVNGRVFYEGTLEPVKDVVVSVRGTTTYMSSPTSADGSFALNVPKATKELYFSWGGSADRTAAIASPTGEYRIIPKPVRFVPTAPIDIPSAAWTSLKRSECRHPRAAFALDTTIPAHKAGAAAYVDIRLRDGVRFVRAFTLHLPATGNAFTLTVDRTIQRRWVFTETNAPVRPLIEVCLEAPPPGTPSADAMAVTYWYEERK